MAEQEFEFRDTASDFAKAFGVSESAAWRMAREKRLPEGTFVYLNARTVRFSLARMWQKIAKGEFSAPPKK